MKATHRAYYYVAPDGAEHHEWFIVNEAPKTITSGDGCVCVRKDAVENSRGGNHWRKGLPSVAAGVMPYQREEAMQAAADVGCPTYYNEEGDPVHNSRRDRARFHEAMGFFDKDAGYGDYAGDH